VLWNMRVRHSCFAWYSAWEDESIIGMDVMGCDRRSAGGCCMGHRALHVRLTHGCLCPVLLRAAAALPGPSALDSLHGVPLCRTYQGCFLILGGFEGGLLCIKLFGLVAEVEGVPGLLIQEVVAPCHASFLGGVICAPCLLGCCIVLTDAYSSASRAVSTMRSCMGLGCTLMLHLRALRARVACSCC
jgi:hypothetical protein